MRNLVIGVVVAVVVGIAGAFTGSQAQAAPTVTLLSVQGLVPVGAAPAARARLSTARAGLPAASQVWTGSAWATSQIGVTDGSGQFSLPLTFGRTVVGTFRFRMGVVVGGVLVTTREFRITRYRTDPFAYSAPASAPAGANVTVRARVRNTGAGATVRTQILVSGRWSASQSAVTDADGYARIPLTYGKASAGTVTWRLAHTNAHGVTSTSRSYSLVRFANGRMPDSLLCQIPWARTGWRIACRALPAFTAMSNAYKARFGRSLQVDHLSTPDANCYRTYAQQVRLRNLYLAGAGSFALVPGTSEHGWGLACDINMRRAAGQPLYSSATYLWLRANAARYGFVSDIAGEDWHWAYTR